jgi:hypothetical protein
MVRAGYTFSVHSYYIIPYVPVMALLGGYALQSIRNKWIRNFLVFALLTESLANQQHDFRIKPENKPLLRLESISDSVSTKTDLIIINGGFNPVDLYYTHRKGWSMENKEVFGKDTLQNVISRGCRYLYIHKKYYTGTTPVINYPLIYQDDQFMIYKLTRNI